MPSRDELAEAFAIAVYRAAGKCGFTVIVDGDDLYHLAKSERRLRLVARHRNEAYIGDLQDEIQKWHEGVSVHTSVEEGHHCLRTRECRLVRVGPARCSLIGIAHLLAAHLESAGFRYTPQRHRALGAMWRAHQRMAAET